MLNLPFKFLEKTRYLTGKKAFDQSTFLLKSYGKGHDDVILFLSSAMPCMVKAGKAIGGLHSKKYVPSTRCTSSFRGNKKTFYQG